MDMVIHEAVRQNPTFKFLAVDGKEFKIFYLIFIISKKLNFTNTSTHDVVHSSSSKGSSKGTDLNFRENIPKNRQELS